MTRPQVASISISPLLLASSLTAGDTLFFFRTGSKTYTAWPGVNWQEKYSDSYGVIRYNGKFYSATNFTASTTDLTNRRQFPTFSDYEYCVAPIVNYTATATHVLPSEIVNSQTLCTFQVSTFKNASSSHYTNRFFNLLEFEKNLFW